MDILFDGVIGAEITAADFSRKLESAKGASITIEVNSPGGSVTEGLAIYNALKKYPGRKTAHVVGIAASMMSAIIMSCDEIIVEAASSMMIHFPSMTSGGTADDHKKAAQVLEGFAEILVGIYAERSKKSREAIRDLLRAETWYFGAEAVAAGFADSCTGSTATARAFGIAQARANFAARAYKPSDTLDQIAACVAVFKTTVPQGDTVALEAQARRLCGTDRHYQTVRHFLSDSEIVATLTPVSKSAAPQLSTGTLEKRARAACGSDKHYRALHHYMSDAEILAAGRV